MPELPEVETIKNDLQKLIVGCRVLDIKTDSAKQIKPSLAVVKKALFEARIEKIKRNAKILQIFFDNQKILLIHLKLTGRLLVRNQKDPIDDWQHITVDLNKGKQLRFADSRKFGWFKLLNNQKELNQLLKEFGPEPLTDLDLNSFLSIVKSTRRPIKVVLMDQKKIAGVGNIYANDALFLAKIDPRKPADKLKESEAKLLFEALNKVLKAGIKYRGASDQYYLDALGHKGAYQEHFLVYGRDKQKCFGCQGEIKRIKVGGRGTFFCPSCQK